MGLLVVVTPVLNLGLAHLAFKVVVYWTVAMSGLWFANKALGVLRRNHSFKSKDE